MANRRFYFAFENLALSDEHWQELIQRMQQRGANQNSQPSYRNHWRISLDGQAIIFEALFNEAAVNPNAIEGILASITGTPPPDISSETTIGDDDVTIYTISGTDSLRQIILGGENSTWAHSREHTIDYLRADLTKWEDPFIT